MHSAWAVWSLWPVWLYNILPQFLITVGFSGKKTLFDIKCMFWLSLLHLSEAFLAVRRIHRDIIIAIHRLSYAVPLCLSDFNENWFFSTGFRKTEKCLVFRKSNQWLPSSSIWTDRQILLTQQSLLEILQTRLKTDRKGLMCGGLDWILVDNFGFFFDLKMGSIECSKTSVIN